jgi:ribosome-associated translation inhibitor RaiA
MASVSIRGIHVEITQAMREHAQMALEKIFERNHPIAHEVVVRALPKAEISISLSFQCAEGRFKVSRTVEATAFYSGMTEAVKVLSSNIDKSRGQMAGRRNGGADLTSRTSGVDDEAGDEDVYEDVA